MKKKKILKRDTFILKQSEKLLTYQMAKKYLNIRAYTNYKKTLKSQIPHFKLGKKLYFKKSDLKNWLMRNKISTDSELEQKVIVKTKSDSFVCSVE